ncbi:hypothetical protein [Nakamurella aerolata]|uniref:Uncharacterized protein n=1 Tax=Nakamurella aerolata TaxID=1656892 RepID=A0A849A8G8_9ACTN|nr:hypothetical protein [Nakamurella aerolata]NNG36297.1 hypothetical protein [Nakamurella aerolata]
MTWQPPSPRAMPATTLREHWRARTERASWAYPSDWHCEAVDALCEAVSDQADIWEPGVRLGQDRASAAVGLAETLADVDILTELIADEHAEPLRRAVSLGWSERATAPAAAIVDPLTGLACHAYLQERLGEVYRAADAGGEPANDSFALVVFRISVPTAGLARRLPMVLVADAVRAIFDAGETLALLGDSTVVVLARRTLPLARRIRIAHRQAQQRIERDEQVPGAAVHSWTESLPATVELARALLTDLSR